MEQIEMLKSCQLVQRMLIQGFNGSKAEANKFTVFLKTAFNS